MFVMLASCVDVDDEDHDGGDCEVINPPRSNSQSKRLHSEVFPHGGGGTRGNNMFRNRSRKQSTQNRTGNPNFGVVDVNPYGAWGPGERNTKPNNCRKSVRLITHCSAKRTAISIRKFGSINTLVGGGHSRPIALERAAPIPPAGHSPADLCRNRGPQLFHSLCQKNPFAKSVKPPPRLLRLHCYFISSGFHEHHVTCR